MIAYDCLRLLMIAFRFIPIAYNVFLCWVAFGSSWDAFSVRWITARTRMTTGATGYTLLRSEAVARTVEYCAPPALPSS